MAKKVEEFGSTSAGALAGGLGEEPEVLRRLRSVRVQAAVDVDTMNLL